MHTHNTHTILYDLIKLFNWLLLLWKKAWSSVELYTSLLRGNVFYSFFLQSALGSLFLALLCTSFALSSTHIYYWVVHSLPSSSFFLLPQTTSLYSFCKLQCISLYLTTFPSGTLSCTTWFSLKFWIILHPTIFSFQCRKRSSRIKV